MASIEEKYKASEYAKLADKSKDKTPISLDGGKDLSNPSNLEKARGGKLNSSKYSDSVER
jgi:hypothetical protein